jgi:hypothetical protein
MIIRLTRDHSQQIIDLINSKDTLMSQSLDEIIDNTTDIRRKLLSDNIIRFFTREDNPYAVSFGKFEGSELKAVICANYSHMIPAWSTAYVISNYESAQGALAAFALIKEQMKFAESRGYYQYYTVVEKDRADAYDRLFKFKMQTNYLTAIDEVVPASHRPINDLFWGWLFDSKTKSVDTVVVNHWLPREHRK